MIVMVVRRKGHGECPSGTKEYRLVSKSQMSGKKMESIICAKDNKEAVSEYDMQAWPQSLWKRIR